MAENKNEAWEDQQKTYSGFLNITKWSIVALVILVVLLYVIVQP